MSTTALRIILAIAIFTVPIATFEEGDSYYKILNVPRNAKKRDIKKAYHKASMEYHPDRNKSPNARDKFALVAEAYEVLNDEDKRRIYDREGKEGLSRQQHGRGDFGGDPFDMFNDLFGGGFGGQRGGNQRGGRGQRKGPELATKIR